MDTVCYMEGGTGGCGTLQVERKLFGNANLYLIFAGLSISLTCVIKQAD